jgi:hypothetical protein
MAALLSGKKALCKGSIVEVFYDYPLYLRNRRKMLLKIE